MSHPYILITGASSGIGEGFARALGKQKKPLILVARRQDRLEKLAAEFPSLPIEIIPMDLTEEGAAKRLHDLCQKKDWIIGGIINNAGLGTQHDLHQLSSEQLSRMLNLNIRALTEIMHTFLPGMITRRNGFIHNIASTAAFQPVPHFSVYAATKAYVLSLCQGVHEEVRPYNVYVSCLCPGPVSTEFQENAGMDPRFFAVNQPVDEVVQAGLKLIQKRSAIGWTSFFQFIFSYLSKLSPFFLVRKIAAYLIASCEKRTQK